MLGVRGCGLHLYNAIPIYECMLMIGMNTNNLFVAISIIRMN